MKGNEVPWVTPKNWDAMKSNTPMGPPKAMATSKVMTPPPMPEPMTARPPSPAKSAPPDASDWGRGKPQVDRSSSNSTSGKGFNHGKGGKGFGKGSKPTFGTPLGCVVCLTMGLESKHDWQQCPKWKAQMQKLREENSK